MNQKDNYKKYAPVMSCARWALDLILPPRCPVNGSIVNHVGAISPEAWKNLTFISDPQCTCCGVPFESDFGEGSDTDILCGECLATPRPYDRARSVLVYNDGSRSLILAFKHGDKTHLHTTLAPLLNQLGKNFWDSNTVLVPVPLHWLRLVKRRYNQAALLSQEVSKMCNLPCWPDALIRTRHTPPQGHKNAKDRHKNVNKAFDIHPTHAKGISGKHIVLIDDVFTTGATLEECAKVLKSAGAKQITVLTLARALKN